jgi:hypothetical protein
VRREIALEALQSMDKVIDALEKEFKFSSLSSLGMEITYVMICSMSVIIFIFGCGILQYQN